MILPAANIVIALSLLGSTSALPFASSPSLSGSTDLNLDASTGDSREYPSWYPQQRNRKRGLELDLGEGNGGIVVLNTNAVDDGSLAEDSSFRNDESSSPEEEEEEGNDDDDSVFDPNATGAGGGKVVRNPKVIPNPKNPAFSSSLAAAASSTTTTTTTTTTPAATSAVKTYKGEATYFYQNGVAGACGNVNLDSAYIVALDYRLYGDLGKVSKYCGKSLTITNTANGKSVVATVADACPTCSSQYSLDLSEGAFGAIGDYDTGILPIKWSWN